MAWYWWAFKYLSAHGRGASINGVAPIVLSEILAFAKSFPPPCPLYEFVELIAATDADFMDEHVSAPEPANAPVKAEVTNLPPSSLATLMAQKKQNDG